MGLHLSRTPHIPAHRGAPTTTPRLHRSVSSPVPHPHPNPNSNHLCAAAAPSSSRSHSPHRSPSRLLPPPARSALKKPRGGGGNKAATTSSSVTPDTASASSTGASSVPPLTPTWSSGGRLLARFLGKERGLAGGGAQRALVVLADGPLPERKAVRFGGLLEEEDE